MKKLLLLLMIMIAGTVLVACSQPELDEEPQFLEVELAANPEKADVNEEITFEAKITYGTEEVEDADEVKFEIWRAHDEEHEKILVEHSENGLYVLKKSFDREGTYYIISHVTARSMHNMPKIEFVVGAPSEQEEGAASDLEDMEHKEEESEDGHNGH
ncbi:FixH family protein [Mesobacillus subterraneus]|uniref:YtkA-like domain-containing protein n=1 Tax=Mesobacillus subterraneus TaxID=285983 RepID=A0A3R9F0A0_9BACI|nr:FixH family protein [Mesobacillus subterraneus]RSD26234.1 hypothetical protein EJA10_15575 [Mesobacillus subterraneus]